VDKEDRVRAGSNKDKVLTRLIIGPATNHQLREIGGSRAMGRVNELQKEGHRISVVKQNQSTWLVTLTLRV
jgi:hypothetical protein